MSKLGYYTKKGLQFFRTTLTRDPYLNNSRINQYLQCPLKYKFVYMDRKKGVATQSPQNDSLNLYKIFVYGIQDFLNNQGEKTIDRFKNSINRKIKDNPIFDESKQIINNNIDWIYNNLPFDINTEIKSNEKLKTELCGCEIECNTHFTFNKDAKINYVIIKTTKKQITEKYLLQDINYVLPILLGESKHKDKFGKIIYFFPSVKKVISYEGLSEELKAKFKEIISNTIDDIKLNKFPGNRSPLCSVCEYLDICPSWPIKPIDVAAEPEEVFNKRIRLSYSKLSQYINCPSVYKKTYIDRIPSKPRPFFSFGTAIHETFEKFYDYHGSDDVPTLDYLLEIWNKIFKLHPEGYESNQQKEQYYQDGITQLTNYYNRFVKDKPFQNAAYIEEYFEIPMGKEVVMIGFIDRIDKLDDGTYEILDYKTEPTDRPQAKVDKDMQLTIYYWAAKKSIDINPSQLSLFMLDFDKKIVTTRTDKDIEEVEKYVDDWAIKIKNDSEYKPNINKYCKSCDYLNECELKDQILNNEKLKSMQKFDN